MPSPYMPVRKCVYCGSTRYSEKEPTRKLGDEHIIPLGFRGVEILRGASCEKHELATSQIENHCVRYLLRFARPHLGLRGRRSKQVPDTGPFSRAPQQRDVKIPTNAHPGYMVDFTYPYPNYLVGGRSSHPKEDTYVHVRPLVPDFEHRVHRLGGKIQIKLGEEGSDEIFARLLAKIAHVYAVAELGFDGFEPWLLPIILGEPSQFATNYLVGTGIMEEPRSQLLHEVGFSNDVAVKDVAVVRIRLFANLQRPSRAHYVVVGRLAEA
jgi:hypothetical protein